MCCALMSSAPGMCCVTLPPTDSLVILDPTITAFESLAATARVEFVRGTGSSYSDIGPLGR